MIVEVANQVVLITGSSRGIGNKLAECFAAENAHVIINYNESRQSAFELYDKITSKHKQKCLCIKADINNAKEIDDLSERIIKTFGRIDVLINNAGINADNSIENMAEEDWRNVVDVNLTGTFLVSKSISKYMIRQRKGKIINIASFKGQEGSKGQINYCASKAGILGLTKSMAKDLGKYNISVNAICPGLIITDLNRNCVDKIDCAKACSVLGIENTLDDLLNFIVFLASEKVNGVSGRVFNLDSRIN